MAKVMLKYNIKEFSGTIFVESITLLVKAFKAEKGLSEEVYLATCNLIREGLGEFKQEVFRSYIDAIEGRYYLNKNAEELTKELFEED